MRNLEIIWACPECGTWNTASRQLDNALSCKGLGLDCSIALHSRNQLTWDDYDYNFVNYPYRDLDQWLKRGRLVENDEYFEIYHEERVA